MTKLIYFLLLPLYKVASYFYIKAKDDIDVLMSVMSLGLSLDVALECLEDPEFYDYVICLFSDDSFID